MAGEGLCYYSMSCLHVSRRFALNLRLGFGSVRKTRNAIRLLRRHAIRILLLLSVCIMVDTKGKSKASTTYTETDTSWYGYRPETPPEPVTELPCKVCPVRFSAHCDVQRSPVMNPSRRARCRTACVVIGIDSTEWFVLLQTLSQDQDYTTRV